MSNVFRNYIFIYNRNNHKYNIIEHISIKLKSFGLKCVLYVTLVIQGNYLRYLSPQQEREISMQCFNFANSMTLSLYPTKLRCQT